MDQTINANIAQCIMKVSNLGMTRVTNICNGTSVDVPWGTMDWFGLGLGTAVILLLLGLFGGLLKFVWNEF